MLPEDWQHVGTKRGAGRSRHSTEDVTDIATV
jgi:hypothetical protein